MAVRCIIKENDQILLCHMKADDFYFLPGGSVEFQEELHTAIEREFAEEMGLTPNDFSIGSLLAIMEVMFGSEHSVDPIFEVKLMPGTIVTSQETHIDFAWIKISSLDDIDLRPRALKPWLMNGCKENHLIHNSIK